MSFFRKTTPSLPFKPSADAAYLLECATLIIRSYGIGAAIMSARQRTEQLLIRIGGRLNNCR